MADTTTIYSPVEGFTGTVAGVDFADGTGETDDLQALAYFARQGYGIDESATVETGAEKTENVRPQVQAGTPLRDAAVDPQSDDYLAPADTAEAQVSPHVHGDEAGAKPIVSGDVPGDPSTQDVKETVATVEATDTTPEEPAGNAPTDEWQAYALASGATEADIEGLGRNELREQFGS